MQTSFTAANPAFEQRYELITGLDCSVIGYIMTAINLVLAWPNEKINRRHICPGGDG